MKQPLAEEGELLDSIRFKILAHPAEDNFYDGVTTGVGAATALREMADTDIQHLI